MKVRSELIPTVIAVLTALVLVPQAQAYTIIYDHDFNGTGNLHKTPVDVGTGSWTAHTSFLANGSITSSNSSATLPFIPSQGAIYTLDSRITGMTATSSNWIGIGFADGSSTGNATGNRFTDGAAPVGKAWNLVRSNTNAFPNLAILGTAANGLVNSTTFSNYATFTQGLDLRIELDTRGGPGTWTATWLAKLPSETNYTVVRPTTLLLSENITSVGITKNQNLTQAVVQSFTLTLVPEPSTGLLLALGGLGFLGRRRR